MARPEARGLQDAAEAVPPEGLACGQLLAALPGRQQGWLMLLCAMLSGLPGLQLGWICGPVLVALAVASWRGQAHVRVPERLARRRVGREAARRLLIAMAWTVERLERWCRPCWPRLARAATGRGAAGLLAAMALLILLPLPGSNLVPSLAVAALAAALLRHDGRAMALAWLLALAGLALTLGAAWAMAAFLEGWR
jgi:hypothetical protein